MILSAAGATMLGALLLLLTTGARLVNAQGPDVIVIGAGACVFAERGVPEIHDWLCHLA